MALSLDQFVAATQAELTGDRLILGVGPTRRFVGDIFNGVFSLNEEGQAIAAEVESTGAYTPAAPAAAAPEPAVVEEPTKKGK